MGACRDGLYWLELPPSEPLVELPLLPVSLPELAPLSELPPAPLPVPPPVPPPTDAERALALANSCSVMEPSPSMSISLNDMPPNIGEEAPLGVLPVAPPPAAPAPEALPIELPLSVVLLLEVSALELSVPDDGG